MANNPIRESNRISLERSLGDFLGAFADGGVLIPLIVLLSTQGTFSAPILFASAGLAYLVSGIIFRTPMPIQPLKAIAIAAVAIGASGYEIRVSGLILGMICLLMNFADVDHLAKKIPTSLIHCVQLGLGIILINQGINSIWRASLPRIGLALALISTIWYFGKRPVLGILAVAGILAGLLFPSLPPHVSSNIHSSSGGLRLMTILSLVLPQIALTLTNSVVATADVAQRYFGQNAKRVNVRNLLLSIGMGNILSALVGGLPYCHGSGGMTAHYRGGSRTYFSNVIIGSFMLAIAVFAFTSGKSILIGYPDFLLASLLATIGIFHIGLVQPTWENPSGKLQLIFSGTAAMLTRNMLVVLAVAIAAEFLVSRFNEPEIGAVAQ